MLIKAGNRLSVVGSNVIARQGDVTLIGQQVNIVARSTPRAARNSTRSSKAACP